MVTRSQLLQLLKTNFLNGQYTMKTLALRMILYGFTQEEIDKFKNELKLALAERDQEK